MPNIGAWNTGIGRAVAEVSYEEAKSVSQSVVPMVVQVILAGLGLAVSVLMVAFGVLWTSITKLRDDVRQDIDHVNSSVDKKATEQREAIARTNEAIDKKASEQRVAVGHLSDAIDVKAGEHRQGQQQLWSEFRLAEIRANEYRARVEGILGELPKRDEIKEDLRAMEQRISQGIRGMQHGP